MGRGYRPNPTHGADRCSHAPKDLHFRFKPSLKQRVEAQILLQTLEGSLPLLDNERDQREGEDKEPRDLA